MHRKKGSPVSRTFVLRAGTLAAAIAATLAVGTPALAASQAQPSTASISVKRLPATSGALKPSKPGTTTISHPAKKVVGSVR
jgi:hypothetical protein